MTGPARPCSPLRELSALLQGVLDRVEDVARTDERLASVERRLGELERRLDPTRLTVDEQLDLSVCPPVLPPERGEADIEPPERPGDDYRGAGVDEAAIEALESRAAEALSPKETGSQGFDGLVRGPDGVSRRRLLVEDPPDPPGSS